MAGYDLKKETYIDKNLTGDEIWSVFSSIFSNKAVGLFSMFLPGSILLVLQ